MNTEQRGFGRGRRGRGGKPQGGDRRGARPDGNRWKPLTKLGRDVDSGKIKTLEEIFKFSMPIKEVEIVDKLIGGIDTYKEEVMKVKPVQKQTTAGQRTRMKVWVLIGDGRGHIGLGQKAHKEVQGAVQGAIAIAKMNIIPVRMGYWGNNIGMPHTVPMKITGKEGSVSVRLVPAPRGTGIVGAPTSKKVLQMAGVQDCYTQTRGCTKTKGNFLYATYYALAKTYTYLTPEFWGKPSLEKDLINITKAHQDENVDEEEM
jgi:small subunit ribosomal protein S2e